MKLREILATIAQIRPHAYTDAEMITLVNTIEGRVYTDILMQSADFKGDEFDPFKEGEEERELAVPVPFTDLYIYYLASRIDYFNGDVDRYNDSMVLYNDAWDAFAAHYRRNNKPKQTNLHGMLPHGWR